MAVEVVIGLDVGTQSSKAVACAADGRIMAEERIAHGVSRPGPGRFEHDAETVWWHDTAELLKRIAERPDLAVQAICVSAIGPTALPADAEGRPLRPAMLYGIDTRAREEVAALEAEHGGPDGIAVAGSAVSSQSPVPKLLWLKRHEPQVFGAMRRWFTASAWLAYRLTGTYAVDHHSASQFVPVYHGAEGRWRDDLWAKLLPGIEAPALAWPGERIGGLTREASAATGLPDGLPVVMGTVDAWSEAYSAYADRPGTTMIMYGSTFFFVAEAERFVASDRFWGTRSVRRGSFSLAGGMATGGLVLDWLAKLFGIDVRTVLEAALSASGPSPLVAMPYLSGERTPFSDHDVRAVLYGMNLDTGRDEVCRAFVISLALAVRDNLDAMRAETGGSGDYVAVGGGASSLPFLQLICDVAGITQIVPERTIGAALGDARLAAESLGWPTNQANWNPVARVLQPAQGARAAFDPVFERFKELYRSTRHLQLPGGGVADPLA